VSAGADVPASGAAGRLLDIAAANADYRFRCRKIRCVVNLDGTDDPLIECVSRFGSAIASRGHHPACAARNQRSSLILGRSPMPPATVEGGRNESNPLSWQEIAWPLHGIDCNGRIAEQHRSHREEKVP